MHSGKDGADPAAIEFWERDRNVWANGVVVLASLGVTAPLSQRKRALKGSPLAAAGAW